MMHQTVDEDSSSSANSGELNDVFGIAKGPHEHAGVTPGLRRRRERAERQKSFLKEQQEINLRPFEVKDDIINRHGKKSSFRIVFIRKITYFRSTCFRNCLFFTSL